MDAGMAVGSILGGVMVAAIGAGGTFGIVAAAQLVAVAPGARRRRLSPIEQPGRIRHQHRLHRGVGDAAAPEARGRRCAAGAHSRSHRRRAAASWSRQSSPRTQRSAIPSSASSSVSASIRSPSRGLAQPRPQVRLVAEAPLERRPRRRQLAVVVEVDVLVDVAEDHPLRRAPGGDDPRRAAPARAARPRRSAAPSPRRSPPPPRRRPRAPALRRRSAARRCRGCR